LKILDFFFVFLDHLEFDLHSRDGIVGFLVTVVIVAILVLTGAMIVEN